MSVSHSVGMVSFGNVASVWERYVSQMVVGIGFSERATSLVGFEVVSRAVSVVFRMFWVVVGSVRLTQV